MRFKAPNPTPRGLWMRTPPAIFPPVMGLFGLGLAWRRAAQTLGAPTGIGDAILGATTVLFVFCAIAYAAKVIRRPKVVVEDLRILPGRAGVAVFVMCFYLLSLTLFPLSPLVARLVLFAGLVVHAELNAMIVRLFLSGPPEQRRVSPVWHLLFTSPVIAALATFQQGYYLPTLALAAVTSVIAMAIWAVSLDQAGSETVPAPLRPLLAIHLSPAALLGLLAQALEFRTLAIGFAILCALMIVAMVLWSRPMLGAGFSPLWGALTFPLAATVSLWLVLGGGWAIAGGVALVAATLIILPIAYKILRTWAGGQLAIRTNAAAA